VTRKKDVTSQILHRLDRQEKEEGALPLLLQFYRELLQIQSKAAREFGTAAINLSDKTLRDRLLQGIPMLGFADLTLNWSLLRKLFSNVAALFARYPQLFGEIPDKLNSPEAARLLTKGAVKAWFNGKELPASLADSGRPELLHALLHATLNPFLAFHAAALTHLIDQERWRRRYCPVCGGSPDISYMDKERGSRWLVCCRCDTEWVFQRLECPYCGNKDQSSLAYFTDEKEVYRLYVCEKCKRYIKTIDLQKTGEEILAPLERLWSLNLDTQAKAKGYIADKSVQRPA
jgi:FdhE protein